MIATVCNICFGVLAIPFGYLGLAMASALSAAVNASLLYRGLAQSGVYKVTAKTGIFVLKVAISACLMGASVAYFSPNIESWYAMNIWLKVYWLGWLIVLAAIVYFSSLFVLGIRKRDFRSA
ncbi:virulence factor-like MviN [Actinobacillus lignieresii]|nr:virulence factor-like MviN [Actinobacillus lignieresii]